MVKFRAAIRLPEMFFLYVAVVAFVIIFLCGLFHKYKIYGQCKEKECYYVVPG